MNCGEKIAELRKKNGMTQDDLGKEMNVSYQAVSKWERDESQPDFETMSKIAKLFNVPLSYFEEGGELNNVEREEAKEEPKTETTEEVKNEKTETISDSVVGTCTECGKLLKESEVATYAPKIICKNCSERKRQAEILKKQQEEAARKKAEQDSKDKIRWEKAALKGKLIRGLWIAAIPAGALLIAAIVLSLLPSNDLGFVPVFCGGLIMTLFTYCFTAQMIWGGTVRDVFTGGGHVMSLPGVIFSLSPDGIIFLIITKIFLALVAAFVFVASIIFCVLAAFIISPFTFIPSLLWKTREIAKVK